MRVDAHQHFWTLSRGDYDWLTPDQEALYRDYGPAELKPLLDAAGIDTTILVQAAPTEDETRHLLDLAASESWISGVVGWTDLAADDAVERIAKLGLIPKLRGLRPMLQDLEHREWIARPELSPALDAMARAGLVFDALIRPDQLCAIATVADRHRDLSVVVDHAAKPDLTQTLDNWASAMRSVATRPNVTVKLSGLLTQAPGGFDAGVLKSVVQLMLDAFGHERLVWGSDWPVLTGVASYADWIGVTVELLDSIDDTARAAILGENAARIYGIAM